MKAVLVLVVCLFALACAEEESSYLSKSEKIVGLIKTQATMLHKLGAMRSQQNANLKAIFSPASRQSAFCDSDSENRELLPCDSCSLIGFFQNETTISEDISYRETDEGQVDLVISLGIQFQENFDYRLTSEIEVLVDEEAAEILNAGQEAVCETDYEDIDYRDSVIRDRVSIDGAFDSREECLIDSCEYQCRVVEEFSQTICGSPINVETFANFIGDLISELGVDFDSDIFVDGLEDSNFLTELIQFGSEDPCEEVEDDYPARFGVNFGDSDDSDCNTLFFDVLPETGLTRGSGGRLVAGMGLVLASLLFALF